MKAFIKSIAKQSGLNDVLTGSVDEWDFPELEEYTRLVVEQCVMHCLNTPKIGDHQEFQQACFEDAARNIELNMLDPKSQLMDTSATV